MGIVTLAFGNLADTPSVTQVVTYAGRLSAGMNDVPSSGNLLAANIVLCLSGIIIISLIVSIVIINCTPCKNKKTHITNHGFYYHIPPKIDEDLRIAIKELDEEFPGMGEINLDITLEARR